MGRGRSWSLGATTVCLVQIVFDQNGLQALIKGKDEGVLFGR